MTAANAYSALDLCNQAFRALGEKPITSFTDTTNPRSLLAHQFYAQVRDTLLGEHFWNFATVRATLYPYAAPATTLTPAAPTGTNVLFTAGTPYVFNRDTVGQGLAGIGVPGTARITARVTTAPAATLTPGPLAYQVDLRNVPFTASAAVFSAADVGSLIEVVGPGRAAGIADIHTVSNASLALGIIYAPFEPGVVIPVGEWVLGRTDQVRADISAAFSGAAIPAGQWHLTEPPPAWGFASRMRVPADMVAMQRTQDSVEYQREGDWFVSNESSLSITYTSSGTDMRHWPAFFVSALVAALTAAFAEQITGQLQKAQTWYQLSERRLARAKVHDGREGTPPVLDSGILVRARFGGRG